MSHDTLIHRIARIGVRPFVNSPVTPNHVTTLRLATGLAAAAAFAHGAFEWAAWGGGLFLVSMVLDRADGELARLGGKTTPWGHKYDLYADSLCNALAFAGIGIGLRDDPLGPWVVLMGIVAGLAVAGVLVLVLRLEALAGARAGEVRLASFADPDDAMIAVPVAVWLGWAKPLIVAAVVGAPLFLAYTYIEYRRRLRAAQRD